MLKQNMEEDLILGKKGLAFEDYDKYWFASYSLNYWLEKGYSKGVKFIFWP